MMLLMFSCIGVLLPLLDLRRRFKAVMDVLDSMIRLGRRCLVLWSLLFSGIGFLRLGLFILVRWRIFMLFRVVLRTGSDVHHRLSDFIHGIVVQRRDEAIQVWRNWLREDPLVHPKKWLKPDMVPLHFSAV